MPRANTGFKYGTNIYTHTVYLVRNDGFRGWGVRTYGKPRSAMPAEDSASCAGGGGGGGDGGGECSQSPSETSIAGFDTKSSAKEFGSRVMTTLRGGDAWISPVLVPHTIFAVRI